MSVPASRQQLKPPERGVFALDHDGECKPRMQEFLQCLKKNKNDHFPCKDYSKAYLSCRMEKKLMVEEDLDKLGFGEVPEYHRADNEAGLRDKKGYIAGTGVKKSKNGLFGTWN